MAAVPRLTRITRDYRTMNGKALQEPDTRSEATEALRGLVDAIVLTPDPAREALQIELRGNLAAMLCIGSRFISRVNSSQNSSKSS